jgi:hypothetical protein
VSRQALGASGSLAFGLIAPGGMTGLLIVLRSMRRAMVSDCLAELQQSKAIDQRRGRVVITEATTIAAQACERHRAIGAELRLLFEPRPLRLMIESGPSSRLA